jgi:Uma2 family endonuclease
MTVTADPVQRITPEDLLRMPDGDHFELVDGRLVELKTGWKSSWIAARLVYFLSNFCRAQSSGWIAGSASGYQCFPDAPGKVRRPDVSFIRLSRLPVGQEPDGHCRIVPDLAVEVVSPNDSYYEVEEKVREYLQAGVQLVWVINPAKQSARVHRKDGGVSDLSADGKLEGEDVLPGFRCELRQILQGPAIPQGETG